MGAPGLVTPANFQRALCVYDLEKTLVEFIANLFTGSAYDNPYLNINQRTQPEHPIVKDPDQPPVSYDPGERARTLAFKVTPRVVRGRVPRTITGEIDTKALPDFPSITVQAVRAHVQKDETFVLTRIMFHAYDENPDSQGYQDVANMMEKVAEVLTSWGQKGIDDAYVIRLPFDWTINESSAFPHFTGELSCEWELPSGRPLPDAQTFGIVPGEHLDLRIQESA